LTCGAGPAVSTSVIYSIGNSYVKPVNEGVKTAFGFLFDFHDTKRNRQEQGRAQGAEGKANLFPPGCPGVLGVLGVNLDPTKIITAIQCSSGLISWTD